MTKARLFFIFSLTFFISCNTKESAEGIIYLIPKDYQGIIMVIFNEEGGHPVEYQGEKRVYRIPANGVLRSKFQPPKNLYNTTFFYSDSSGNKIEIPYFTAINLRENRTNSDKIICFNREIGVVDKNAKDERRFEIMLISSIKNLDSISNKRSMTMWRILGKVK